MIAVVFAAAMYTVTPIVLPTGTSTDALEDRQFAANRKRVESNATLARNGAVGVLLHTGDLRNNRLLIVRTNGTHVVLSSPTEVRNAKTHWLQACPQPNVACAMFENAVLADDGTPFATLRRIFSGAYSGVDDVAARWTGTQWTNAAPRGTSMTATNLNVAAVDTPENFAVNGDFGNSNANFDAAKADPRYQAEETAWCRAAPCTRLGYGSAKGIRGSRVVGFDAGLRSVGYMNEPPHATMAVMWQNARERKLGPGVAYAVDGDGNAVGSDEATLGAPGFPILWPRTGKAIRLGTRPGVAVGISESGTIVGTIDENVAFVASAHDLQRRVLELSSSIDDRSWSIDRAFGIASNGRILARGHRHGRPERLLLLDPHR